MDAHMHRSGLPDKIIWGGSVSLSVFACSVLVFLMILGGMQGLSMGRHVCVWLGAAAFVANATAYVIGTYDPRHLIQRGALVDLGLVILLA